MKNYLFTKTLCNLEELTIVSYLVVSFRIEHELLARIMSEMTPPVHDPTSNMRTSQSSESIRSYDSEPDIAGNVFELIFMSFFRIY